MSVTVTAPLRAPVAVGVKVTVMEQLAAAAIELPQLLVWPKSPLAAMLVMVRLAVPVLVRVTFWVALAVANSWLAKTKLAGAKLATGAVPVPVKETV